MEDIERINGVIEKLVKEYLESIDDVYDNANRNLSPTGLFNYVLEKAMKYSVKRYLPERVYKAHVNGYIYVHKLPYSLFIPYCCGHSIQRFLSKGLIITTTRSKPARHYNSFIDHVVNYLASMQQYFSGAQSLNTIEYYAGPFIRRDHVDYRGVKQEIQRLLFNLNFPTRIGMQSPFTNFTIVLDAPKKMLYEDHAVYAGEYVEPLIEYFEEAKMFVRALAENFLEGDGAGRPFTFPVVTLMATAKTLYDDPEVFDAVFKTAAVRGSFYWLNTRVVNPDTSFSMCCRINIDREYLSRLTSLSKEYSFKFTDNHVGVVRGVESIRSGGVWALPDITGSIGVVTINLPRIALESKGEDSLFYEKLDSILEIVREALLWMRMRYHSLAERYPVIYSMPLEYIPEVFRLHGSPFFSTIGVVGLPEAVAILLREPKLWIEPVSSRFSEAVGVMEKIMEYIVGYARKWSIELGQPFNVEEVPGETACIKLALKDLEKYPEVREYISHGGVFFYSNSIIPYYTEIELSKRILYEARVQKLFTGGVMMHIFLGEEADPEALARLTKRITYGTDLLYWSYTPAVTVCRKCGFKGVGVYHECPKCGSRDDVEIWSRIVGYYRPIKNWYPMRRKEFWTRKHYKSIL